MARLVTEVLPNLSAEERRRIEAWFANRAAQTVPESPLPPAPPKQAPAKQPLDDSAEVDDEATLFARATRSLARIELKLRQLNTLLAAAQMESGQFANAIHSQREALRFAPAEHRDLLTRQLERYKSKLP